MVSRTSDAEVRAVIETDANISTVQHITSAGVLVDRVETNAIAAGDPCTAAELQLMETYLAAHFYSLFDRKAISVKTGRSTEKYPGGGAKQTGLESTSWGQMALAADCSGQLAAITGSDSGVKTVGADWVGTEII